MVEAVSWSHLRSEVEKIYTPPMKAPNTCSKMKEILNRVEEFGEESPEDRLERSTDLKTSWAARYIAWRAKQGVCNNTIRGDVVYLSAVCSIAAEEGWLGRVPGWRRIRPRKGAPARKVLHSIEEVRKVLLHLQERRDCWEDHRLLALTAVVACTGLRRKEALRLQVQDVDLAAKRVHVVERDERLKTVSSAAPVPMCPELATILEPWISRTLSVWLFPGVRRRGPWTGGTSGKSAGDRIKQVGEDCGVEGLTLGSLRHTFATWARRRFGLNAVQLKDVLRHTTVYTQEHYVHDETVEELLTKSVEGVSYLASA